MSPSEKCPALYLVDETGNPVNLEVAYSVIRAFLDLCRRFPQQDPALMANWAEEVARYMQELWPCIDRPKAMAFKRLRWKIYNNMRLKYAQVETVGGSSELDVIAGFRSSYPFNPQAKIHLDQMRAFLDSRENIVLSLLLEGHKSTELYVIMGLNYHTGRRLEQRVKLKVRKAMSSVKETA